MGANNWNEGGETKAERENSKKGEWLLVFNQ